MEKDFRVRAFLYFVNEGVARGLYNHVQGLLDDAVDINPESPNAEWKQLDINDSWTVACDLCFPPELQDTAEGLYQRTENMARNHAVKAPTGTVPEDTGLVWIERCGHRIKAGCTIIERYEVV